MRLLTVDAVRYEIDKRMGSVLLDLSRRPRRARRQDESLCADGAAFRAARGSGKADHHDRAGHRHCAVPRVLHERQAIKATGRNWLFFGHQRSDYDYFYEDELVAMRGAGLLTRLTLAWSRDGKEKTYVQHPMRESPAIYGMDW